MSRPYFSRTLVGRLPLIEPAYVPFRRRPDPHAKLLGVVLAIALAFLLGTLAGCCRTTDVAATCRTMCGPDRVVSSASCSPNGSIDCECGS